MLTQEDLQMSHPCPRGPAWGGDTETDTNGRDRERPKTHRGDKGVFPGWEEAHSLWEGWEWEAWGKREGGGDVNQSTFYIKDKLG